MQHPPSAHDAQPREPAPDVVVSVWGRFHGFDLARELATLRTLRRLITSYPRFALPRFGVDPRLAYAKPLGGIIERAGRRAPVHIHRQLDHLGRDLFQTQALRSFRETDCNLLVTWSGTSLRLLREANRRGIVSVLERGSAHILRQDTLLRDEYTRWGLNYPGIPKSDIETELAEYEETDFISVPSAFAAQTFIESGIDASRLLVNPYGADLSEFRPAPRRADNTFRILQVGSVSLQKGYRTVIRAFQLASIPNSELVFVGTVSPEAKAFFGRGVPDGVKVLGPVPQTALPELYRQADIVCLGSVQDGFGLVLLQAIACGIPIVTTDHTGGPDVIGDSACGIVVPWRETQSMADAFARLYEDVDLRATMSAAARARACDTFSWKAYGMRATSLYSHALRCP